MWRDNVHGRKYFFNVHWSLFVWCQTSNEQNAKRKTPSAELCRADHDTFMYRVCMYGAMWADEVEDLALVAEREHT